MNPINLKIILKFQLKHFAEIIFLFVSVVNFLSLRQKTFQPTDLWNVKLKDMQMCFLKAASSFQNTFL